MNVAATIATCRWKTVNKTNCVQAADGAIGAATSHNMKVTPKIATAEMRDWTHYEKVWKGPFRWRIKQAWWMLRHGTFKLSMEYKTDEGGSSTMYVDNQRIQRIRVPEETDEVRTDNTP